MSVFAPCPHRPPCPGCPSFGDLAPSAPPWQALEDLCKRSELPPPTLHSSGELGFRHRARLAVRGRARSPKVGLFQTGSHRIADIPNCAIHHPQINETVRVLKQAIRESGVRPYADRPHTGQLRYIQIVVERQTEQVQVVLVGNGTSPEILGALPEIFIQAMGNRLQGLFFNAQPDRNNTILGPHMVHLAGETEVRESIAGVDVFYPPGAFGQNHLPLFEQAVSRIGQLVAPKARVAEYYCGVGGISLGLLGQAEAVHFNERSPDGLSGLDRGLRALPKEERERAQIHSGAAGDFIPDLNSFDAVIVDPPRKGLDSSLLDALKQNPPKRLIYLACGLPALLRELPLLTTETELFLAGVEAFDFFPFTDHLETLVWLDRNRETG